ncbi:hypothetical protein OSJ20_03375 [Mycobacterium ulcerans]|uniref:hypothetical protein n=1 Tax=Mycobacterium ulcerans TaxID=1809 RepID=UPI001F5B4F93|nr:hypothetical protein [Mycobacterium ulcerans]MEB3908637.1 hypothetical protein [Mycobacterium ulcerans]MEB3918934.1 hypothetical protein [Mycobacterium ulcerans]MEB3923004.1 hypothetical protein [Mycobacterium ulcerans]MEB3927198.1 hypothetical protein [Mycobacterium ulcerans]MEB3935357.1 hypothetical protein [Mycobacterium ulcerans]
MTAVFLRIDGQRAQGGRAGRGDVDIGAGTAGGGDANDSDGVSGSALKIPDPQRIRPTVAVQVTDPPFVHVGRGGGAARRASRCGHRPRCGQPDRAGRQQHRRQQ